MPTPQVNTISPRRHAERKKRSGKRKRKSTITVNKNPYIVIATCKLNQSQIEGIYLSTYLIT